MGGDAQNDPYISIRDKIKAKCDQFKADCIRLNVHFVQNIFKFQVCLVILICILV